MPGEGVAAEHLAVGAGAREHGVWVGELKVGQGRLDFLPFLAVLRHVHAELVAVVGDGEVRAVVEVVRLDGRAPV